VILFEQKHTEKLRSKVLACMCLATAILSLILGGYNIFVIERLFFGVLEFFYASFSFYLFIQILLNKHAQWHKSLYIYSLAFLVIFGAYLSPLSEQLFTWALVLPIVYYLLLGQKAGLWITLISFVIHTSNIYLKADSFINPVFFNFVFCYFLVWTISHAYESTREASEKALGKLALKDSLTGANNRLAMQQHFDAIQQIKQAQKQVILLVDIDFFKMVNDQYGHEVGDCILKEITFLLAEAAGSENVFRIGGEEFCIFLQDLSTEQAIAKADDIRSRVKDEKFDALGHLIPITISIGVADYEEGIALSEWFSLADQSLYRAKRAGRDRVCYLNSLFGDTKIEVA